MDLTLLYTFSTFRSCFFFYFIGLILPCLKDHEGGKLQGKGEVIRGGVGDVLEDCVDVVLSGEGKTQVGKSLKGGRRFKMG